ncbi:PRTRC system ThiF family protein [Pedobacter sp. GR22-10]|uniref:PRTRC system ThiF family protein n=1 Tax=Pedobacter sp. GR22-10 TaxID=2994472 RepID=UPI0022471BC4|nr:PRTRC system ThiF family protein [Pedobacter sp. GR22-10]MCX2429865.1 PRTRC system ThiF family protein [Pedobacter sp. GR22-10]
MKNVKTPMHLTHNFLINPTNPVTVNLIGGGGTGSHMLTALAKMNYSLNHVGHPGLQVNLWDDDVVTQPNVGRQLFAEAEIGLPKSVALINKINRFFGFNWKAKTQRFEKNMQGCPEIQANLYISCVDTATARFEIAEILSCFRQRSAINRDAPLYWLDTGNSQSTGQVILGTIPEIKQPPTKRYKPVSVLPFITDEFRNLLEATEDQNEPSCSTAEALQKQDLFINPHIAILGASLIWNIFSTGMTDNRGFFTNLKDFTSAPLKVA